MLLEMWELEKNTSRKKKLWKKVIYWQSLPQEKQSPRHHANRCWFLFPPDTAITASVSPWAGCDTWYCTGSCHLHGSQEQGSLYMHLIKVFHKAYMNNHCGIRLTRDKALLNHWASPKSLCTNLLNSMLQFLHIQIRASHKVWTAKMKYFSSSLLFYQK